MSYGVECVLGNVLVFVPFLWNGTVDKPGCPLAEKEGSGAAGTETTESIIYFQPRIVPGFYFIGQKIGRSIACSEHVHLVKLSIKRA